MKHDHEISLLDIWFFWLINISLKILNVEAKKENGVVEKKEIIVFLYVKIVNKGKKECEEMQTFHKELPNFDIC